MAKQLKAEIDKIQNMLEQGKERNISTPQLKNLGGVFDDIVDPGKMVLNSVE